MEEIVPETTFQLKYHFQTGEVTGRVHLGTVGGVVPQQRQLGKLDVLVNDQRYLRVPLEDHVVGGVRDCKGKV